MSKQNQTKPIMFIPVGGFFTLKKDKKIYKKTSPTSYVDARDKDEFPVETFIKTQTTIVTETVYKDPADLTKTRTNVVWKNVTPFILIFWDTPFKWLFDDTVYIKSGFKTYKGVLMTTKGPQQVEFTLLSPIDTLMEVVG